MNINEIAKLSGYSKSTISKALNDYPDVSRKTKEKILKICKENGYFPSFLGKSLSTNKTNLIGIVFDDFDKLNYCKKLNEILTSINENDYNLILLSKSKCNFNNISFLDALIIYNLKTIKISNFNKITIYIDFYDDVDLKIKELINYLTK